MPTRTRDFFISDEKLRGMLRGELYAVRLGCAGGAERVREPSTI